MLANQIKAMKDNKSPRVDGIPEQLLMEIIEQMIIPLARLLNLLKEGVAKVFNLLKEGVVPVEWKQAQAKWFAK